MRVKDRIFGLFHPLPANSDSPEDLDMSKGYGFHAKLINDAVAFRKSPEYAAIVDEAMSVGRVKRGPDNGSKERMTVYRDFD